MRHAWYVREYRVILLGTVVASLLGIMGSQTKWVVERLTPKSPEVFVRILAESILPGDDEVLHLIGSGVSQLDHQCGPNNSGMNRSLVWAMEQGANTVGWVHETDPTADPLGARMDRIGIFLVKARNRSFTPLRDALACHTWDINQDVYTLQYPGAPEEGYWQSDAAFMLADIFRGTHADKSRPGEAQVQRQVERVRREMHSRAQAWFARVGQIGYLISFSVFVLSCILLLFSTGRFGNRYKLVFPKATMWQVWWDYLGGVPVRALIEELEARRRAEQMEAHRRVRLREELRSQAGVLQRRAELAWEHLQVSIGDVHGMLRHAVELLDAGRLETVEALVDEAEHAKRTAEQEADWVRRAREYGGTYAARLHQLLRMKPEDRPVEPEEFLRQADTLVEYERHVQNLPEAYRGTLDKDMNALQELLGKSRFGRAARKFDRELQEREQEYAEVRAQAQHAARKAGMS